MRSQIFMTRLMSCSISRMVSPNCSRIEAISPVSRAVSAGFMPAAGSSSSNRVGRVANARAISRRRCSP